MSKYEVIESRSWVSNSGRRVSIYGAAPWHSDAQRDAEGWRLVANGYTLRNPYTGEVGLCRPPFATREEAETWAQKLTPSRIAFGA